MKRFLSLALAGTMCLPLFAACGSSGGENASAASANTADTAAAATETEITANLPTADYGGYAFRMYMRDEDPHIVDMYVEELTGETMNDAIYERNSKVSDDFNVKFTLLRASNAYGSDAVNTVVAGDDAFDIYDIHARHTFKYSQQGVAVDWNTLKWVDLDQPWWCQDARKAFSFCGKIYCMIGDISYLNLGATDVMIFNKKICTDNNLEFPYQTVLEGKWTFDKMGEMAKTAVRDLDGDGKWSPEKDQFGYVTSHWLGPIQVLYSGNQRICTKDANDEMVLSLNTPRTVNIFEKYFALTDSNGMYISNKTQTYSATDIFKSCRSLFLDLNVKGTMNLREMEDDFGILPWPKFDDTETMYYSNVDAGCNNIGIPITNPDLDRTSAILEDLAFYGYRDVLPVYYDVVLTSKYVRDAESVQMIDLARAGRVFDIGYFYLNGLISMELNSVGYYLANMEDHSFASHYATYESKVKGELADINAAYREMANRK